MYHQVLPEQQQSPATVPKSILTIPAENIKKFSHLNLHLMPLPIKLLPEYAREARRQGKISQKRKLILRLKNKTKKKKGKR